MVVDIVRTLTPQVHLLYNSLYYKRNYMKIIPLILILITGCVNWTPDNIPHDRIIDSIPHELEKDENIKLAQLMKKSA